MRIPVHKLVLCVAGALAFFAAPLSAATTIFLRVDGIPGEATDPRHKDWIQVISFSFGATGAADTASEPKGGDVVALKNFDKATPKLLEAVGKGTHFREVQFEWTRTDGAVFLKIRLSEVIVSAVNYGTTQEGVSFNWRRMEIEYTVFKPDGTAGGTVVGSWDKTR